MFRILGCATDQADLRVVVLAALACVFGCYTALGLLGRARTPSGAVSWPWQTAAATVAGAGVWATHFVAMLAFRPGFPIGYDVGLTALSIAIAMSVTWFGFAAALHFRVPAIGGMIFAAAVGAMHF